MNLSDHLAALGVPAPSTTAAPVPASGADHIQATCEPIWLASVHDHPGIDVLEMLDTYQALQVWMIRFEIELARYGSQVTKPKHDPKIPKRIRGAGLLTEHGFIEEPERTVMSTCDHPLVEVNEKLAQLECRTCHENINPVWWLSRHHEAVSRAENWRRHIQEDKAKLVKEIDELKEERARLKQAIKRAKETGAKEWLRLDGSGDMVPKRTPRKRKS